MSHPFAALKNALRTVFDLEPKRMGRYTYPEIQQLQQAFHNLELHNGKKEFIAFLKALREALPHIEKRRIDFASIKVSIDDLAKAIQMPIMNWDQYLSRSNGSPKFQFSALNHQHKEISFLTWLSITAGKALSPEKRPPQVILLLECKDHLGFSQKLSDHLNRDPDFLFRLIMESDTNFIQIVNTRISLYLTDKQLAQAIIKHASLIVQGAPDPLQHATMLVDKLNEILSNGRSISTLLRNTEAKSVLDCSELFRVYQDDKNNTGDRKLEESTNPPSTSSDGGITPTF